MAKNVTIAGASYPSVPSIILPQTGGGNASFFDVSDTTASASDVAQGKYFYAADGTRTLGTSSGGGTSPWTLIKSQESAVSTTSTSAATAVTIACGSAISTATKIVWVHIRDTAGARAGYFFGSDAFFINTYKANGGTTTFTTPAIEVIRYTTSDQFFATAGQYGVYGYSISGSGSLIVRRRYNSSYSLTVDGTYAIYVYTLDLPDNLSLFE